MKKIFLIFILIFIQTFNLRSEDFALKEIISGLNSPWSLTFKEEENLNQNIREVKLKTRRGLSITRLLGINLQNAAGTASRGTTRV